MEAKWDGSGNLSKGLEQHQIRRHKILGWFNDNWNGEVGEAWDRFAEKNNPQFKKKFKFTVSKDGKMVELSKSIPSSRTILGQNLQTVLKEIGDRKLEAVLLIFYKGEPSEIKQEGFTTINIQYKPTLNLYSPLNRE